MTTTATIRLKKKLKGHSGQHRNSVMSAAVAHTSIPRVPSTADAICGKSQQRDAAVKQLALVPMWKPLLVVLAQLWALRAISVDTHVRMRFGGLSLGATRRGYAICDAATPSCDAFRVVQGVSDPFASSSWALPLALTVGYT